MLNDKRCLVVVPARGGSKGIKLKNIRPVLGIPLVARVGRVVTELEFIDRAVVSTDHRQIAEVARNSGLDVPFMRPPELSGDVVSDWDVLHHALLVMEEKDKCTYDIIVMLQPTSPMRRPEHVRAAVERLLESGADSVWTVSETDSKAHPLKQLIVREGKLGFYDPEGVKIVARQQLAPLYHRNGIAYAITRDCLESGKSIMGEHCEGLVVDGWIANIDTELDIKIAELIMKELQY